MVNRTQGGYGNAAAALSGGLVNSVSHNQTLQENWPAVVVTCRVELGDPVA
ncbi:MAG: hypothetical protein R3C10_23030 [Pirellulales bacterium]